MSKPTPSLRLVLNAELTPAQVDSNFTQSLEYTEVVENLLLEEHNADGTHKYPGAVRGSASGTFNTPGTAQTYNLTVDGSYTTPTDLLGIVIIGRIDVANYYSATQPSVKINTVPALHLPIRKFGDQNLSMGDLCPGQEAVFLCDGTYFQLLNPCTNSKQNYGSSSGTNTYTVTVTGPPADTFEAPPSYYAGYKVAVLIGVTNNAASTLQIVSTHSPVNLTAKAIQKAGGQALTGGELAGGSIYEFVYDGTQFQLLGRSKIYQSHAPGSGADITTGFQTMFSSVAHLLGQTPDYCDLQLVCVSNTTASGNYTAGDVIDAKNVIVWAGSHARAPFNVVYPIGGATFSVFKIAPASDFRYLNKAGSAIVNVDDTQFAIAWTLRVVLGTR